MTETGSAEAQASHEQRNGVSDSFPDAHTHDQPSPSFDHPNRPYMGTFLAPSVPLFPSGRLETTLEIRPIPSPRSPEKLRPICLGMRALAATVSTLDTLGSLTTADQESLDKKSWVITCLQSYTRTFHERWPIVHLPVFDPSTEPLVVVASVLMIGAWYENDEELRNLVTELHLMLVDHLLRELVRLQYRRFTLPDRRN